MNENNDIKENDLEEKENNKPEYKIEPIGKIVRNDKIKTYKVIIIGQSGVGKTCISYRIMNNEFNNKTSATLSLDVSNYQIKINDKIIQIQFWDTCGNDEFAKNTPNLFKNTSIAIIVYAINNKNSFENVSTWNNILLQYSYECIKYLIGNKADLENEREVSKEEAEQLKENYNFSNIIEISAKSGLNIKELLDDISINLYEKFEKEKNDESDKIFLQNKDLQIEDLQRKGTKKKNKINCC